MGRRKSPKIKLAFICKICASPVYDKWYRGPENHVIIMNAGYQGYEEKYKCNSICYECFINSHYDYKWCNIYIRPWLNISWLDYNPSYSRIKEYR